MVTQKEGGLVARAVREALGTLVSPTVYTQLVTRALRSVGLSEIPEQGRAIADWISGPLQREIETAVGADAAELVAAQLAPIVAHASGSAAKAEAPARRNAFGSDQPTGVANAPKPRPPRSDLVRTARVQLTREQIDKLQNHENANANEGHTARPQAVDEQSERAKGQLRQVLGASADASALKSLAQHLLGSANVTQIGDLVGLLDALEEPGMDEPIVLLDCRRPTVHVTSIAAIGEDLPSGTTIVLWGASDEAWRELDRDRLPNCKWVRCSQEATPADVAALCSVLLRGAG